MRRIHVDIRSPVPAGQVVIGLTAASGIAAVALGMVLTPGPNMIYLVSRSIAQGSRAGLISLAGVGAGFLVYMTAAAAGVSTVLALVPTAYDAMRIAGCLYLLWLAWRAVRPGGESVFSPKPLPPDPPRRLFTMGLVTNLLNPKSAILYLSLLPQFIEPERGQVALQSLLLGLIQIVVALTGNALFILTAGSLASLLNRRPRWLRIQRYAMGTVLAGLAVHLAVVR
ncbi:LysE family translocator [Rhizohabitans arisaemae]|uniref:LysE family translocator n=1 Tax=Rhizohabitans arisaemae TaxID=2720610 RepID=UPI0024B0DE54|nr:LysE family translocator [Rhizohabitans arisaemae]